MATHFGEEAAGSQTVVRPEEPLTTQRVAQYFFAAFWTIIFTGCFRKWLFPGTSIFYLLQDVPITLAYLYAISKGYFTRGLLFMGIGLLSAILILLGLLQVVVIGLSPQVAFIGLHHYLYYLPMMLIFPLGLTPRHRRNFIRWNLWSALAMFPLSMAQAVSPTNAWINRSSEGDAFALPGTDVARISGPFNFSSSYGIWIAIALALCFGEWLQPRERRASQSTLLLSSATFIWAIIALVSGSRENIVLCAAGAVGAALAAVITRSKRGMAAIVLGVIAMPIAVGLVAFISPVEYESMTERFTDRTNTSYDMKGRVAENLVGWAYKPDFSFIGKGVGMGIDAAHAGSADAYGFTYSLAESDPVRNVMELGTPVGYLWCTVRFGFALGMIVLAWRLMHIAPHTLALACMLFAQVTWELTRNATTTFTQVMIGYSFIFGVAVYPYLYEPPQPAEQITDPEAEPALPAVGSAA
ncbi:MAG TPA: hypothetical protein VL346_13030 [Acidobacteriaceae bacterium]|nr:hypothetical protein [Acidobacteriaceae bacterium]